MGCGYSGTTHKHIVYKRLAGVNGEKRGGNPQDIGNEARYPRA
jgi:hypothetical protein